jgi:hypothetical protein
MNRYQEMEHIFKHWTAPRELLHSPPRQVQLSAGGKVLAALGFILVMAALVGGPLLIRESLRQADASRAFQAEALETEGRVLRLSRRGDGDDKRYIVEYSFTHDGRSYSKEGRVSSSRWKKLKEDGPLGVTYLPSNPGESYPSGRQPRGLPIAVPIVAIVAAFASAVAIAWGLNRSRELLEYGRVAPAVITDIQKYSTGHGASGRVLKYEFPTASGALAKGKSSCDRKGVEIGSVLSIMYDPNQPRRSALYPMQLVKVSREA